jgi:hypothetical protein
MTSAKWFGNFDQRRLMFVFDDAESYREIGLSVLRAGSSGKPNVRETRSMILPDASFWNEMR